jgi:hypothetical protein
MSDSNSERVSLPVPRDASAAKWLRKRAHVGETAEEAHSHLEFSDPGPLDTRRVYARGRYNSTQVNLLLPKYVRIRGDLLVTRETSALNHGYEDRYAVRCAEYLAQVKSELEGRRPNLPVSANLLSLADRTLIWLYPKEILDLRFFSCMATLRTMRPIPKSQLELMGDVRQKYGVDENSVAVRTALEDGMSHVHSVDESSLTEDDLQVTRLRSLLIYVVIAWLMLMLVVPYVTIDLAAGKAAAGWPVVEFSSSWLTQIVAALGISALGAAGGVISGLLSVRDSRARMDEYRTSMLKLALKPTLGSVAALVLYLMLSWQVLSGLKVTSGGTYVLAAFLAGFSERWFLKLVRAETAGPDPQAPHDEPIPGHRITADARAAYAAAESESETTSSSISQTASNSH